MTALTEGDDCDQGVRLLTIADHHKWEAKYQDVLIIAESNRNKTFDDAEAKRFSLALDAILRAYQSKRKLGLSKGEAGDALQHGWCKGLGYTYTDLHQVLKGIGWQADAKRADAQLRRDPYYSGFFSQ